MERAARAEIRGPEHMQMQATANPVSSLAQSKNPGEMNQPITFTSRDGQQMTIYTSKAEVDQVYKALKDLPPDTKLRIMVETKDGCVGGSITVKDFLAQLPAAGRK